MSREVRRVPVGWRHPVEPDRHWYSGRPGSPLRAPGMMFTPLMDDYAQRYADWEREGSDLANRVGRAWTFRVQYHLTGYKGDAPKPFWEHAGQTAATTVRDEDHLHRLLTAQHAVEEPDPFDYMPTFDGPPDELGWCLYETVSAGTPVTPVFATAEGLIEHLCTVGQDWDPTPFRREAAERLVRLGHSFATFAMIGGVLLDGARDLDRFPEAKS